MCLLNLKPSLNYTNTLKRMVVEAKYEKAGAKKGKYVVIHGIKSDSKASMQSRGDPDSLLPIEVWAEIADAIRYAMLLNETRIVWIKKICEIF